MIGLGHVLLDGSITQASYICLSCLATSWQTTKGICRAGRDFPGWCLPGQFKFLFLTNLPHLVNFHPNWMHHETLPTFPMISGFRLDSFTAFCIISHLSALDITTWTLTGGGLSIWFSGFWDSSTKVTGWALPAIVYITTHTTWVSMRIGWSDGYYVLGHQLNQWALQLQTS